MCSSWGLSQEKKYQTDWWAVRGPFPLPLVKPTLFDYIEDCQWIRVQILVIQPLPYFWKTCLRAGETSSAYGDLSLSTLR